LLLKAMTVEIQHLVPPPMPISLFITSLHAPISIIYASDSSKLNVSQCCRKSIIDDYLEWRKTIVLLIII
jgi:hypothetical protein